MGFNSAFKELTSILSWMPDLIFMLRLFKLPKGKSHVRFGDLAG